MNIMPPATLSLNHFKMVGNMGLKITAPWSL
jgi:hypothetical protein